MFKFYTNDCREFKDFNIIQYGVRRCEPGFAPGMKIHGGYLLHYVYEGEGHLETEGKSFPVEKNQAFVIFPNQLANYISSKTNPFLYKWIEFGGLQAENVFRFADVTPESPVFTDPQPYFAGSRLSDIVDSGVTAPYILMSKFYSFAQALCPDLGKNDNPASRYVDSAINYVMFQKNAKLTVSEVAEYLNLSPSYLSSMFARITGKTLKQYITESTMSSAALLLKNRRITVSEVAEALGYYDVISFSKAFKRYSGMSPTQYREKL